jgi:hypothetical protein
VAIANCKLLARERSIPNESEKAELENGMRETAMENERRKTSDSGQGDIAN